MQMMLMNPWFFGLEAAQQGWQAQSALAFRLMRSFAGGVPDQTASSPLIHAVADDIKEQEEVAATAHVREAHDVITGGQAAPDEIADVRLRKAPKVLRASKKTSRVKTRGVSKRKAAASQNSARKAVRRSTRPR
jgi:hypothetical protein